ncbi:MAG: LPS export ABC transporter ATP-binding protein [Phycisphaerae bacterium]|nr:LPS export ABC transporter ATP-binding protein [Phycisphaerae bacterium]
MIEPLVLLEARDLVKRYGGRTVVDHVGFQVGQGEIVGLLGPNGAGKTTSFRMTVGMIDPDGGTVIFNGQDITRLAMYKRVQLGMGYLSQESSVFTRLTVEENLLAILETLKISHKVRRERCEYLLEQFNLLKVRRQHARTLSGGEKRKLEIARALIINPTLILLDEPFSGVDPKAVEDLQKEILRLKYDHNIAILLTDHNVRETLRVTDRAYIVHEGKLMAQGKPAELVHNPLVRKTYLGEHFRADEFTPPPIQS